MTTNAYSNKAARDQPRTPPERSRVAVQVGTARASARSAKEGQTLHYASQRTVVPLRETNERDVLVGMLDSVTGLTIIWRKPKMAHAESLFKSFFAYLPIGRTRLSGMWPFVQPRRHERLVPWKRNDRTDTEG